jgi:hypothetical protein
MRYGLVMSVSDNATRGSRRMSFAFAIASEVHTRIWVVLGSCPHHPVTRRAVGTQGREVDVVGGFEKLPNVIGDRNCHAFSS